jgi:Mg2+ and Co2+ transporter CorA
LLSEARGAETALDQLHQTIRADMDLLMLRSLAIQQESSRRLEGQLAQVTALLLVPGLIAGIFGANTLVPGQGAWRGFFLMLGLMAVSSLAIYALMIREVAGPDRFAARQVAHRQRRDSRA